MNRNGLIKGFTLVEILIATSISLVIMVTVLGAFRTGVFGYHEIEATLATDRGAYQALERIRLDLRNALVYREKQSGFKGDSRGMSFYTLVDVFQGEAWQRQFALVSYRWDGRALVRSCRMEKSALREDAMVAAEQFEINDGQFALQYGRIDRESGAVSFVNTWDPAQGIPAVVSLRLTMNNIPFERTVRLPAGGIS